MKLSKYFLSAFAFVFAIGGAFASFTSQFSGWITDVNGNAIQALSVTACSETAQGAICTADSPNTNQTMYATPAQAEARGNLGGTLFKVIP